MNGGPIDILQLNSVEWLDNFCFRMISIVSLLFQP